MTSDAKIGLLLGLVFIFIIAFVVNGLPRLRAEPDSNELTIISAENVVNPETVSPGLAARERNAQQVFENRTQEQRAGRSVPNQPADSSPSQETGGTIARSDESVRYQTSLPESLPASTNELLGFGPRGVSFESSWLVNNTSSQRPTVQTTDSTGLLDRFLGRPQTDVNTGPQTDISQEPTVVAPPKRWVVEGATEIQDAARASLSRTRQDSPLVRPGSSEPERLRITTSRPRVQSSSSPKEYVVSEGENLAVIAKKVYGEEEGNRMVNIDLIFKANTGKLESPDKIKVGQKLNIPALPGARIEQQANVFPESLVKRVTAMGRPEPAPKAVVPAPGAYYVAKDGDSLWKIAAAQLGKGHRYAEIFELNNDIMKDPANVVPGMRLRMPAN